MFPIRGLIEVIGIDLLSSRDQMMKQGFSGLGPPDLVILKKTDLSNNSEALSSHHIEGLEITSPSSFPAYFAQIIQNVTSGKRNSKISITEGLYCCWNSFANIDVHLKVCNPGSCGFYCVTPNEKENYKISDLTWRELSICSSLRFWRGATPLFASLFDSYSMAPPCHSYKVPAPLSPDDIRFAVAAHTHSTELEYAVAHSLIAMNNPPLFFELIKEFSQSMPKILTRVLFYCPRSSPLHNRLLDIVDDIYNFASDDIAFIFALVCLWIGNDNIEKTYKAVPLLQSSLWNEPLAGIAMARICLATDKPDDAMAYLNASCLALTPAWMSKLIWLPNMPVTKPKDVPKLVTNPIESELFISPMSQSAFYLYRTVAKIARDIGIIKLQTLLKFKFLPSKVDSCKIPRQELFPIVEPDEFVNNDVSVLNFLYDPGILSEPKLPRMVQKLPTSQNFLDAAQLVLHDIMLIDTLKRGNDFQSDGNVDPLKAAVISLKLGDFEFAEKCLTKANATTGIIDMLKVRLMCETGWTTFKNVFCPETKKTTVNEHNALIILQEICKGLDELAQ